MRIRQKECTRRVSGDTWFSRIRFRVGYIRLVRRYRVELVSVECSEAFSDQEYCKRERPGLICSRVEILSAVVSCNLFTRLSQIFVKRGAGSHVHWQVLGLFLRHLFVKLCGCTRASFPWKDFYSRAYNNNIFP